MINENTAFKYLLENPEGPFPADVYAKLREMQIYERDDQPASFECRITRLATVALSTLVVELI